jgi:hypothetical protein
MHACTVLLYLTWANRVAQLVEENPEKMPAPAYSVEELRRLLGEWEEELRADGLARSTIFTYVDRSNRFLDWLEKRSK